MLNRWGGQASLGQGNPDVTALGVHRLPDGSPVVVSTVGVPDGVPVLHERSAGLLGLFATGFSCLACTDLTVFAGDDFGNLGGVPSGVADGLTTLGADGIAVLDNRPVGELDTLPRSDCGPVGFPGGVTAGDEIRQLFRQGV